MPSADSGNAEESDGSHQNLRKESAEAAGFGGRPAATIDERNEPRLSGKWILVVAIIEVLLFLTLFLMQQRS